MKRIVVLLCVMICLMAVALSVTAYHDQNGNDNWCNSDADGCWVTGEDGEKIYIMFWSDAAREKYMGKGVAAPMAEPVPAGKMVIETPKHKVIIPDKPSDSADSEIVF